MKPIPPIPDEIKKRMSERIKKSEKFPDCEEWERNGEKYDRIRVGGHILSVPRINYFLFTGKQYLIGYLKRSCGNPLCVKGGHLTPWVNPYPEALANPIPETYIEGTHMEINQTWTGNISEGYRYSRIWPPSRQVRFTRKKVFG